MKTIPMQEGCKTRKVVRTTKTNKKAADNTNTNHQTHLIQQLIDSDNWRIHSFRYFFEIIELMELDLAPFDWTSLNRFFFVWFSLEFVCMLVFVTHLNIKLFLFKTLRRGLCEKQQKYFPVSVCVCVYKLFHVVFGVCVWIKKTHSRKKITGYVGRRTRLWCVCVVWIWRRSTR